MDYPRSRGGGRPLANGPARPVARYQLKVTLEQTTPQVWRRIAVRADMKLGLLHAVLQVAMGWTNSHLHQFLVGAYRYTDLRLVDGVDPEDEETQEERKVALSDLVQGGSRVFGYEYDFGDSWMHRIVVEKPLAPVPQAKVFATCLAGARACPPEDCGGPNGYAGVLKICRNPRHKEYRSMLQWLGRSFDPDAFDVDETNALLGKLKWPGTSIAQLGSIIKARLRRRGD